MITPTTRRGLELRRVRRYAIPVGVLVTFVSAGALAALETHTASSFWEGLWWAVSLITTVGFVGAEPVTVAGKVVSAILMVMGFALLALTTASVASLFVREDESPRDAREQSFEQQVLAELAELRRRLDGR